MIIYEDPRWVQETHKEQYSNLGLVAMDLVLSLSPKGQRKKLLKPRRRESCGGENLERSSDLQRRNVTSSRYSLWEKTRGINTKLSLLPLFHGV